MEPCDVFNWELLESNAHRVEAQAYIRLAIRAGLIRVVPGRGRGIRIVPIHDQAMADCAASSPGPTAR